MVIDTERQKSYQWLLRSLGRYLDEQPSTRISIVEVPDGFLVRTQRALHKLEPHVEHFKRESLIEQLEQLFQQRVPVTRQHHQGIWANFPNGHQDFLRALGFELDETGARNVVIDEVQDGIVVTYTHPANGAGWESRMVSLGITEIETILNEAFNRRTKPGQAGAADQKPAAAAAAPKRRAAAKKPS